MENQSIQDKETLIVGTIIEANKELRNFLNESKNFNKIFENNKVIKLYESKYMDIYNYNMKSLFADITNTNLFQLNEDNKFPSVFENTRKNYYSYFNKVYSFLNGYELNLQSTLNESLKTNDKNLVDINSFKNFLKNIISKLEKQNDIELYAKDILDIKLFAKQPLFIFGYNICNNNELIKELQEKFNLTFDNLLGIVYSKNKKELWFIPIKSSNIIKYSIKNDDLIVENNFIKTSLKPENYIQQLMMEKDDNTLIEIHTNPKSYSFKFTDNLFRDNYRKNILSKQYSKNDIIK